MKKRKSQNDVMEIENQSENEHAFESIVTASMKIHCEVCDKEITRLTKVLCAKCIPHIYLCVNCFADGKISSQNSINSHQQHQSSSQNQTELAQQQLNSAQNVSESASTQHDKSHPYHLISKLNFTLYCADWSAEEELLLNEGLEKYGFGNWLDISDHISTNKSKDDVQMHYEDLYMSNFVEPSKSEESCNIDQFLPLKWELLNKRDDKHSELQPTNAMKQTMKKKQQQVSTANQKGGEQDNVNVKKNELSQNQKQSQQNLLTQSTQSIQSQAISNANNLNLGNNIKQENVVNSSAEIVGYMPKRKDFDVEYDNDAELLLAEMEFTDEDQESDRQLKAQVLKIYNARLDKRIQIKTFVIERRLLDYNYQMGLEKSRTKEEKEIYNLMKPFARFFTMEKHEMLCQGLVKEKQLRARIDELNHYRKLGLKTFEQVEVYLQDKRSRDEEYQRRGEFINKYVFENDKQQNQMNTSNARRTRIKQDFLDKPNGKTKAQHLNEKEQQFCDRLPINPYEYLIIKDMLIRESVRAGVVRKDFAESSLKIDKHRMHEVFDFLVQLNYIHTEVLPQK